MEWTSREVVTTLPFSAPSDLGRIERGTDDREQNTARARGVNWKARGGKVRARAARGAIAFDDNGCMPEQQLIVEPGSTVDLSKFDPAGPGWFKDKAEAEGELAASTERIAELQYTMWAENKHALLVVLQGMDTSGKDGVIRHVFSGVNPQGVRVTSFKKPSETEADHDFLWRIHQAVPARGEIGVFNRSHYEDVLITRVHGWIPPEVCEARYGQINMFEKLLRNGHLTILKFFLHISRAEQKERLEARLSDPKKNWKFQPGDLEERKKWDEYVTAYEGALSATSTPHAPWHIIPSDKKWRRNAIVAKVVRETMEGMKLKWPKVKIDVEKVRVPD